MLLRDHVCHWECILRTWIYRRWGATELPNFEQNFRAMYDIQINKDKLQIGFLVSLVAIFCNLKIVK